MRLHILLPALFSIPTFAWNPTAPKGFGIIWFTNFNGAAGAAIADQPWKIAAMPDANGGAPYVASNKNIQLSGGQTLQIIPTRSANGQWSTGRCESQYVFTPAAGRVTQVEAALRFGMSAAKQGIWPAFWMLGQSCLTGKQRWPACGELDVFEMVNGVLTGHGTAHCPHCGEPQGLSGTAAMTDDLAGGFHTWAVRIDRSSASQAAQSVSWLRDNVVYFRLPGTALPAAEWAALTASPLFFILDVAVGGTWPGAPNAATTSGIGNLMEVGYVAHYVSQ